MVLHKMWISQPFRPSTDINDVFRLSDAYHFIKGFLFSPFSLLIREHIELHESYMLDFCIILLGDEADKTAESGWRW